MKLQTSSVQLDRPFDARSVTDLATRVAPTDGSARGFPNWAYTSQAMFDLEREKIFRRGWVLAAFGHQVPNPGDAVPGDVAGTPVIIWRQKDGSIAGFHNACRHRGAAILSGPCKARSRMVCPYHAWTYAQSGALVSRAYFDGKDLRDQKPPAAAGLNLQTVRVAQWQDLIFVDLSGTAAPLDEFLGPLVDALRDYDLSQCRHAGSVTCEVKANWKFAAENYIEQYHVFHAHPKLLNFSPMSGRKAGAWVDKCFSANYLFPKVEEGRGEGLPHYPNLPAYNKNRGIWFWLYPNLGLELWPDQLAVFRVMPVSPNLTREEIHIYLMGEAADSPRYEVERNRVIQMWQDLNDEDIVLLEALQKGRASPSYDGGVFSPVWEQPVLEFARLIVRDLSDHGGT